MGVFDLVVLVGDFLQVDRLVVYRFNKLFSGLWTTGVSILLAEVSYRYDVFTSDVNRAYHAARARRVGHGNPPMGPG